MLMYMADFETVVEENPNEQEETSVWAWALSRLFDGTEDVRIGNSIETFFTELCRNGNRHIIVYFHNLKFDGTFIMDYLMRELGYETAFNYDTLKFVENKKLEDNQMTYMITDLGIWYSMTVKMGKTLIEFRDSLKLLPFKVAELHKAFDTKYKKLDMEYVGHKGPGEYITPEEQAYIRNDILVPKEALEKFIREMGYQKSPPITIASAALQEFKKKFNKAEWDKLFPNLAEIELDPEEWGYPNADAYCRAGYGGGWCFVNTDFAGSTEGRGRVYDVNSLYPFQMDSKSGHYHPVGEPHFFKDLNVFKDLDFDERFYFIRFKCRFELREGYFPFIQIKNSLSYRKNENLYASYRTIDFKYDPKLKRSDLITTGPKVELTLAKPLFKLFTTCYDIANFEFLDGCWFESEKGLFDSYIKRFMKMKEEATIAGNKARRSTAKLLMNSLYGKFGTTPGNSFYVVGIDEDGDLHYIETRGTNKKPVFVPMAASITSWARRYTVTAAILNEKYFRYSDTDSIHLVMDDDVEPVGIKMDDTELGAWKMESKFEHAIFLRQKTYMEWSGTKYDIKACGLPDRGKMLFDLNLNGVRSHNGRVDYEGESIKLMEEEIDFLERKRTISNFAPGLSIPGKLKPKKIKGGSVLVNDHFTII